MERLLRQAKKAAMLSTGVGRNQNYRLGAVLFERNRKIEIGWNSYKTHPLMNYFDKDRGYPHLHAECHCLIRQGTRHVKGLDLLVVRLSAKNEFTMAKPCPYCTEFMSECGIRNVYYTGWKGEINCLTHSQ